MRSLPVGDVYLPSLVKPLMATRWLLLALLPPALALVAPPLTSPRRCVLSRSPVSRLQAPDAFDLSTPAFDLLSLRSFRRDALLQYDATNQSEPLRIALTFLGVLFCLSFPSLAGELGIDDPTLVQPASIVGGSGCAALFLRNRAARTGRIEKISREYALGDLKATYRGVRTNFLRDLRGKLRVVVVAGSSDVVDKAVEEARVYRRRLQAASTAVVAVYYDAPQDAQQAAPTWLWAGGRGSETR